MRCERYENENNTIVFASSSLFGKYKFWPLRVNFKIWHQARSGQGQAMTQVGQHAYLPKRLDEFGTIFSSLSPSCRELLAKNGLCPHVTSDDLPVTPYHHLHPDHHRWGELSWSWKNWMVSVSLFETGSIFIFPHRLIIERSESWPGLTSLKSKFRDTSFVGLIPLSTPESFVVIP